MANIDAKTKEMAFEEELVYHLTQRGWLEGGPAKFDPNLALYPEDLIGYIEDTQAEELQKLYEWHGAEAKDKFASRIASQLDKQGTLYLLRHGVKDVMGRFQLCQFKPSYGFNPDVVDRFQKNRLRVVRQVPFDPNSHKTLDLVFFINGMPVATAELKTEFTQGIQDAVQQYRKDRKPKDSKNRKIPLLQFKKRALVHFAVSTDEIRMTTHLKGGDTEFLPFNKGCQMGAGNPPNPNGYPISYFWEEILEREAWLDIVGRFIHLERKEKQDAAGKAYTEERLIFPRYHQWSCVTQLVQTAKQEGPGHPYLIQHSTGSGKSNSIAWSAHRLAGLYDDNDNKIFDSVVVITDRKVLDTQLQETIYQFEHKKGVVQKIDEDSKQLAEALEAQVPIVVTTLQKFPVVLERIGEWEHIDKSKIGRGKYAVIVDEAHSSQTGKAANKLKYLLDIGLDDDEELTSEEVLNKIMESKGPSDNISFFAFTATPKHRTIEHFGRKKDQKSLPEAFHIYSMQQAIEEGFILDVLQNYVTYKTFVKLAREGQKEDEEVDVAKAKRVLGKYIKLHPYNISQKIEVVIEHFRNNIKHLLGGKARAMVVTSSREEAVRYKMALDKYIQEQGYEDIKALVAFSGQVDNRELSPESLTEYNMNPGLNGRSLEKAFEEEYQIMLVAEKFQTGFDQPLLCAMYVDKRLSGVAAVQTLGRLNRMYPGKTTFILDFLNEAAEIVEAFKPYYRKAEIAGRTDPNVVNDLMDKLDEAGIYSDSEVEQFAEVYFNPSKDISQGQLIPYLKPAKDRFNELDEEKQKLFKKDLGSFVRAYDFLSMIIPYNDLELEKKCEFARRLNSYLKIKYDDEYINLENVHMSHYRIQKTAEHEDLSKALEKGETPGLKPGSEMGTGEVRPKKKDYISHIIEQLNELFGGDNISDNDRLAFFNSVFGNVADQEIVVNQAKNNTFEQFRSGDVKQKILDAVIDGMNSNQEMSKKVLQDSGAQEKFINLIIHSIYDEYSSKEASP